MKRTRITETFYGLRKTVVNNVIQFMWMGNPPHAKEEAWREGAPMALATSADSLLPPSSESTVHSRTMHLAA